jgi:hypothetical protein
MCLECEKNEIPKERGPNAKTCSPECGRLRKLNHSKQWQKAHPEYVVAYQKRYHAQTYVRAAKKEARQNKRDTNQEAYRRRFAKRFEQLLGGKSGTS